MNTEEIINYLTGLNKRIIDYKLSDKLGVGFKYDPNMIEKVCKELKTKLETPNPFVNNKFKTHNCDVNIDLLKVLKKEGHCLQAIKEYREMVGVSLFF